MLRDKLVVVVVALAVTACSYRHAGKQIAGGLALTGGGWYVFSATRESEGDTKLPLASLGVVGIGVVLALAGLIVVAAGPPPDQPPEPPPAPEPPHVPGQDELRSQQRVARYMAEHGKCDQVQLISARVAAANAEFHATSFATDTAIARCLGAAAQR